MAIIENRSTSEGDILIIKTNTPVVGLLSLLGFTDQTTGETLTDYFRKEFRYSINGGLTYTSWRELTTVNIQNVPITTKDLFIIEYRYIRVGNVGDIEFNNILLNAQQEILDYPYYDRTPFKKFFEIKDINVFGWALNVLEKLYQNGILPEYLTRGQSDAINADNDFIVLFNTITEFFAILVYYSRQFENILTNEELLNEFLLERGLYTCGQPDILELVYLSENTYREFRKRGTNSIIKLKNGDQLANGELLRLICYQEIDEFIFALTGRGEVGWCIGKSSPMYRGSNGIININKSYEKAEEIGDITKYPLTGDSFISVQEKNNKNMLRIQTITLAGIGDDSEVDKTIVIDPDLDYEMSVRVIAEDNTADLQVGVFGFDKDKNLVSMKSAIDGSDDNFFLLDTSLKISDNEYLIRGVIFNQNKHINSEDKLSVGFGKNLIFKPECNFIMPIVRARNSTKFVYDLQIRPLELPISRGILGAKNLIFQYLKNRSEFSNEVVGGVIDRELTPYSVFNKIKYL